MTDQRRPLMTGPPPGVNNATPMAQTHDATLSTDPLRLMQPPGVPPIQVHSETQPLPLNLETLPPPPLPPVTAAQAGLSNPHQSPPVFHPDRNQQMPPEDNAMVVEEAVEEEAVEEERTEDVEMADAVPATEYPLGVQELLQDAPMQYAPRPREPYQREYYDYYGPEFYPRPRPYRDGIFDTAYETPVPTAYKFKRLGDRLAGVILGCSDETKAECLTGLVFGLPAKHWEYLQHVKEGITCYLFNYSRRSIHGIFRSVGPATDKLKPHAWCPSPHMITPYPAQIQVERVDDYPCLNEGEYRPILESKGNYIDNTQKFSFELDAEQVEAFNKLFEDTRAAFPNRGEPPIPARMPQPHGFQPQRFRPPFRPRAGYNGYNMRGRGGYFHPRGGRFPGRGAPLRGRRPPTGSAHPLGRGPRPSAPRPDHQFRAARGPQMEPRYAAAPPPSRPAVTPPPGMGPPTSPPPGMAPPAPTPPPGGVPPRPATACALPPPATMPSQPMTEYALPPPI